MSIPIGCSRDNFPSPIFMSFFCRSNSWRTNSLLHVWQVTLSSKLVLFWQFHIVLVYPRALSLPLSYIFTRRFIFLFPFYSELYFFTDISTKDTTFSSSFLTSFSSSCFYCSSITFYFLGGMALIKHTPFYLIFPSFLSLWLNATWIVYPLFANTFDNLTLPSYFYKHLNSI